MRAIAAIGDRADARRGVSTLQHRQRARRVHRAAEHRRDAVLPAVGLPAVPPVRRGAARGPAAGPRPRLHAPARAADRPGVLGRADRAGDLAGARRVLGRAVVALVHVHPDLLRARASLQGIFPAWTLCIEVSFYLALPFLALRAGAAGPRAVAARRGADRARSRWRRWRSRASRCAAAFAGDERDVLYTLLAAISTGSPSGWRSRS